MARLRDLLSLAYLLAVLGLAGATLLPKLTVRFAPVELEAQPVVVAVTGAVQRPGVYTLPSGARVADALEQAGGPTLDADLLALDLAAPVGDGETLHVPHASPSRVKVSLNRATLEELEALPGIGPTKARRIMEYRPYLRVEDLLRVPGIGEKTLERLRPYVMP